jgi:hypothetical protein
VSHRPEETSHKGVRWRRDSAGRVSFYDQSGDRWVHWQTGVDAPPLPPKWQLLGVPTKVTRPGWRSPWRVVPLLLVVGAVVVAIFQIVVPSGDNTAKETKASAALLGQCLPKSGGHFSSHPVPCTSPKAAVKVVSVIPSSPGSPPCPSGTQAVELAYPGVRYPHIECVRPVPPGG